MKYHFVCLFLFLIGCVCLENGICEKAMMEKEIWTEEVQVSSSRNLPCTEVYNGNDLLGYDRETGIFYCTLGTELTDDWPEISLSAELPSGSRLVWIEDPAQTSCRESVRNGYAFRAAMITMDGVFPFQVVFTGLPMVILHTGNKVIPREEDIAATFSLSADGYETQSGAAHVHLHGGTVYRGIDKQSYRLELHGNDPDGKQTKGSLLGMRASTDWYLLGNPFDKTCIKNEVCWEFWRDWNDGNGIGMLESRMVELFIDDSYTGLYELMERYDPEYEIQKMGGNTDTDAVIRKIQHTSDRPYYQVDGKWGYCAELRYAPKNMSSDDAFALFSDFFLLDDAANKKPLSNEEFVQSCLQHLDIQEVMRYFLFIQVCQLGLDSVNNNLFIWAVQEADGNIRYHFSPWDMDSAFIRINTDGDKETDECNLWMLLCNRMLELKAEGARDALWDTWNEKRETILKDGSLTERLEKKAEEINASGAYLRESAKWRGGAVELNVTKLAERAEKHLSTVAYYMAELWPRGKTSMTGDEYSRTDYSQGMSGKKKLLLAGIILAVVLLACVMSRFVPKEDTDEDEYRLLLMGTPVKKEGVPIGEFPQGETEESICKGRTLSEQLAVSVTVNGKTAACDKQSGRFVISTFAVRESPDASEEQNTQLPEMDFAVISDEHTQAAWIHSAGEERKFLVWTDTAYAKFSVQETELPIVILTSRKKETLNGIPLNGTVCVCTANGLLERASQIERTDGSVVFRMRKSSRKGYISESSHALCGMASSDAWKLVPWTDGCAEGTKVLLFADRQEEGCYCLIQEIVSGGN